MLNLLNIIILNNLLRIELNVLSVEKDDDPQLVMAYRRCEYTKLLYAIFKVLNGVW